MAAKDAAAITGLILAGGEGRRMAGADKGLLPYAGRPLVEHVLERLRPQVADVMISANRNLDTYRAYGHPVLVDVAEDHPGQFAGPLAGLHAGLRACTTPWLVCVPCDSPHLPDDLVARLYEAATAQAAALAVAATAAGMQPTFMLCRRDLLPALEAWLAAGERRVGGWCRAQHAVEVQFADAAAFGNFNDPDSLKSG